MQMFTQAPCCALHKTTTNESKGLLVQATMVEKGQRVHMQVCRGFISHCTIETDESTVMCHGKEIGLAETS